ncbi:MAG: tetratricopeptide repeat protein [Ferruginibacter sp.]
MINETDTDSLQSKIDQLNQEAFEMRATDSNRSFVLSEEALSLAEKIDYTKGKAEGLRTSAFCLLRLSKNAEAKARCEESLTLFKSLNDVAGEGYIYAGLGIIERNTGNYKASLELLYKSLELIILTNYKEIEPLIYYHLGITNKYMGNLEQALEYILKSLAAGREINSLMTEAYAFSTLGTIYDELFDYNNALEYHHRSMLIRKETGDKWGEAGSLDNIGSIYLKQGDYEKALAFCLQSLGIAQSVGDKKGEANSLLHLAQIQSAQNDFIPALDNAKQSLNIREAIGDKKGQAEIYLFLGGLRVDGLNNNETDNLQIQYLNKALLIGEETGAQDMLSKIHHRFYRMYRGLNHFEKALEHLETANAIEKEIHSKAFNQKILNLEISHKIEQSKKEAEIYRLRNVELADLYQQTNQQKDEIQTTLTELKETQSQLIQREKMASLGELTAGIAHEIQNPLNFVNNFSEINTELIDELQQDLKSGKIDDAIAISNDLKENEEKINHHGKRADAIVKGMLQHSRQTSGTKEPTDINALCDEYLRLSYHGLRAKDKNFNADFKTDLDETIGKINIVPQDIGRVLLNLYNNAFYAVNEKSKSNSERYNPIVSVSTKKLGGNIEIKVTDNGNGIPQNIVDKIFQPFFTTKPTGQGTGLGLSLSYDIVKAHGGEIKVETKEEDGTTFKILLPISA